MSYGVKITKRTTENCWEGVNCTYCEVPSYYSTQLQIAPNPSGYRINDGMSADVYCKERGRSFVNSVLAVKGVSKNEIFFRERITVTCSKGVLTPSIFADDNWCAFGCAQVPDDNYVVKYPDMTFQTDLALTPVYTDSTKEIEVSCKNGYSDAVGDNGKKGIRCTSTGYTGYIRRCVEGCDYPLTEGSHTLSVQPNYETGYPYYAADDDTPIYVQCAGEKYSYPIYCVKNVGWVNTDLLSCAKVTADAISHRSNCCYYWLIMLANFITFRIL